MDKFMKDGSINIGNLNSIYESSGYKRSICTTKIDKFKEKKINERLGLKNVRKIKLEEYNPYYCLMSQSKKGYSKKELYVFGRDVLGFNYNTMINNNYKILNKSTLCKLFNEKLRDMKKSKLSIPLKNPQDKKVKDFYKLNPSNCLNGPKKGGMKLNELRDLLVTYGKISEEEAYASDKLKLCKLIKPDIDENKSLNDEEIYPSNKNINLCEKPINRGGIKKTLLNEIAKKLDIDISNKKKNVLCNMIRKKIEKMSDDKDSIKGESNIKIQKNRLLNDNSLEKYNKLSVNDLI
jgi:hypothetical protein